MSESSCEAPRDTPQPAPAPSDPAESAKEPRDASHLAYNPEPPTRSDIARQQRALRRMERNRTLPSWAKKISWILFPTYGFMRLHDEDYERHYEEWQRQQRSDYDGQDPQ